MTQKIGRNDPCPCGSDLKCKHCYGGPRQEPRAAAEVEARDSAVPRALGWLAERHRKAMQAALDELLFEQLWPEGGPNPNEIGESMHEKERHSRNRGLQASKPEWHARDKPGL
ncbi:MAG: hypothetical protein ACK5S1_00870 [bacterium]